MQQLSWSPRSFLLKGFLTDEECEYMIKKARCCALTLPRAALQLAQACAACCRPSP